MIFRQTSLTLWMLVVVGSAGCGSLGLTDSTSHSSGGQSNTAATDPAVSVAVIGKLHAEGTNVSINKRNAADGGSVENGNSISIGANSRARLEFARGGFVELAPATDAEFRLVRDGSCLSIRILAGKAFLETNSMCAELEGLELVVTSHSQVHVDTTKDRTAITVVQGEVTLMRVNRVFLTVHPNEQLIVRLKAQPAKRAITQTEIDDVMRWRTQKFSATVPALNDSGNQNEPKSGTC